MANGKGPLRIAIEDFLLDNFIVDFFKNLAKGVIEFIEDEAKEIFGNYVISIVDKLELPADVRGMLINSLSARKPAVIMALIGIGFGLGQGVIQSFLTPVMMNMSYILSRHQKHARVDPVTGVRANWRNPQAYKRLREEVKDLGYDELQLDAIEDINAPRLPDAELVRLSFRYKDLVPSVFAELERRGWKTEHIDDLYRVLQPSPSPQDLVTFNLRDVFNPEIVNKWGFREDLTQRFLDEMDKLGVDREYAEMYHMAGWQIPSPQLGYEMLHRLDGRDGRPNFTEADLDNILKAADYSPYARRLLIAIAWNLPTRVDIRRMRELNVIDDQTMHYYHRALGYDEAVASQLDEFVLADIADNGKNLTKENIVAGYDLGILSRSEAKEQLIAIDYDETEAEFQLQLIDAQRQRKLQNDEIEVIEFLYLANEISTSEAHVRLDQINVAPDRKDQLIEEWDIRKRKAEKRLSKSEIEDAYERGLIDEGSVHALVQKIGYTAEAADIIIRLIDARAKEDREQELERAAKELDRLQRQDLRDEYAILNADINVKIKELQRDAADIKLAIHETIDEAIIIELRDTLAEIPPQIAELQLQKAQARRETLPPR